MPRLNLATKRAYAVMRRRDLLNSPCIPTIVSRVCLNCNRVLDALLGGGRVMNCVLYTKSRCIVCGSQLDLTYVNYNARLKLFLECNKYIDGRAQCCRFHLNADGSIFYAFHGGIRASYRPMDMDDQTSRLLQSLRDMASVSSVRSRVFADETMFSGEEFKILTGIMKVNFLDLFDRIKDQRYIRLKCYKKDLICILVKMRQGLSDQFLKALFNYPSRSSVS